MLGCVILLCCGNSANSFHEHTEENATNITPIVPNSRLVPAEDISDALSSCNGIITGVGGAMTGKLLTRVGLGVDAALGNTDGTSEGSSLGASEGSSEGRSEGT